MRTWKPDTCECHIEEVYSGTNITGGGQVLNKCAAHATIADEDLYGVLIANPDGENKRKNKINRLLLGLDGINFNLSETVTNPDGSQTIQFKNGITFSWAWTGTGTNRVLTVTVTGFTPTTAQRNAFNNWCTTNFGAGKVVLA